MPEQNPIPTTPTGENTQQQSPVKPPRTLDELKSDASTQLKKILAQGKNIKQFQSNLDLLMQRYHVDDLNSESEYGKGRSCHRQQKES